MVAWKAAKTVKRSDLLMAVCSDDQRAVWWDQKWDETPAAKRVYWKAGWSEGL
jgi:hypothetical protein